MRRDGEILASVKGKLVRYHEWHVRPWEGDPTRLAKSLGKVKALYGGKQDEQQVETITALGRGRWGQGEKRGGGAN